jgi:sec-independent protein translocase protein TatB
MFDIGFWELGLIAIVALLVIGPDKLPQVARTTGMWVGRLRRFVTNVKADIDRELRQEELRKAIEEDAGLDEIKSILNSDRYLIEEEEETKPDYLVKAIPDDDTSHTDLAEPEDEKPVATSEAAQPSGQSRDNHDEK